MSQWPPNKGAKGGRLKRHLRDDDRPGHTWCGRACDKILELLPNGNEIWANGTHLIEVTTRLEDVECMKCK